MPITLSVTDAARGFAELINRVRYHHESATLLKGGKAVAKIVPVGSAAPTGAELAKVWPTLAHLTTVEASGFERDLRAIRKTLPEFKDKWA